MWVARQFTRAPKLIDAIQYVERVDTQGSHHLVALDATAVGTFHLTVGQCPGTYTNAAVQLAYSKGPQAPVAAYLPSFVNTVSPMGSVRCVRDAAGLRISAIDPQASLRVMCHTAEGIQEAPLTADAPFTIPPGTRYCIVQNYGQDILHIRLQKSPKTYTILRGVQVLLGHSMAAIDTATAGSPASTQTTLPLVVTPPRPRLLAPAQAPMPRWTRTLYLTRPEATCPWPEPAQRKVAIAEGEILQLGDLLGIPGTLSSAKAANGERFLLRVPYDVTVLIDGRAPFADTSHQNEDCYYVLDARTMQSLTMQSGSVEHKLHFSSLQSCLFRTEIDPRVLHNLVMLAKIPSALERLRPRDSSDPWIIEIYFDRHTGCIMSIGGMDGDYTQGPLDTTWAHGRARYTPATGIVEICERPHRTAPAIAEVLDLQTRTVGDLDVTTPLQWYRA